MDNQDSPQAILEKVSVQHCGYCSEGHDGKCDGVQCDISEGEGKSTSVLSGGGRTFPSVQSEEMEKLLEAEQFLTFSKKCKLRDYLRSLEADKAKLLADWHLMKEVIELEMPSEHIVLCDVNEFANADISGCACPIKRFRKVLSSLSYTDSPTA